MRSLALLVAILLSSPQQSAAKVWKISQDGSGDAATIQAGVDSATPGDELLVAPGTYVENLDFLGKKIWVRSESGPELTIITPEIQNKAVVSFRSGEERQAILEGFTVAGGDRGIRILNASPSILSNIISDNYADIDPRGGGIWCEGQDSLRTWAPLIKGNVIEGNTARTIGGGIGMGGWIAPDIEDNSILNNQAAYGGGIFFSSSGAAIVRNRLEGNMATYAGGGVYAGRPAVPGASLGLVISENIIADNLAKGDQYTEDSGGGLWIQEDAWVSNNTIVLNSGEGPGLYGGGIVVESPAAPVIERNIIALTRAGAGILCRTGASASIRANLAWENAGGNGAGTCQSWDAVDDNLDTNPGFCNPDAGDFSLQADSPALVHPQGPLGAISDPGCENVPVVHTTWGSLKARYGRP